MDSSFSLPQLHGIQVSPLLLILGLLVSGAALHLFRVWWRLRYIPGPFWAKFTNIQRVLWVTTGRSHEIHQAVHEKYGEVVRFAPNMVSLANPSWIPQLYPIRPGFPKGNFYRTLMPYTRKGGALPAVFNTRDEELHKKIKTPIAPLFSLSNTLPLEVFVDKTIMIMTEQLDKRFVGSQVTFDLSNWLQYFAFDVMGTLTFSKRYGFLEQGKDVNNMLNTIWEYMKRASPMTQIPWFDEIWNKNAFIATFRKATGFTILGLVAKYIADRKEARLSGKGAEHGRGDRDMLSQFFELTANNPSLPPWCVTAWTFSNVIAGSDSTAIIMKTVWYNLLAYPETLHRLRAELLEADRVNGGLAKPFPSWKDVCDLPYLDAVIQEGLRMHPPFCLPLERVVPKGGLVIGGTFFPEGTVVGMSPYVANRHRPTFGEDAEVWNPDRWMVAKDLKQKREAAIMTFGAGRRVCLGRHIAMLELKKIVPALVLRYEFELLDPKSNGPISVSNMSQDTSTVEHTVLVRNVDLIRRTTQCHTEQNVSEILDAHAHAAAQAKPTQPTVRSTDIEAVIWSHHHFDHIGDPSTFQESTALVVGPGVRKVCWPGYPTKSDAMVLDADITGRAVYEINFAEHPLRVGRFDAFDYFGDGSFYLLDSPGHSVGHMTALARVTTSDGGDGDTFVFMGADACHHPGVLRPTEYLPLPAQVTPSPLRQVSAHACPGEVLQRLQRNGDAAEPFFDVSPVLFPDHAAALETVDKIAELDAADNIFVILAHDESIKGHIDLFPLAINEWKSKGLRSATRWLFCKDFAGALTLQDVGANTQIGEGAAPDIRQVKKVV
ncbi:Pisatin demethylase [Cytospora mali]|uniref:Pisatin demethylase n=1 Tax=Cytospora mali TaxID=578113 RepID=A0A194UMU5_CYTMA|nr:Pisatin demethylase [Valsa mali var. pyri (nom. inval.)]